MANIVISNYDDEHNPYYGGGSALAVHEVAKRLSRLHSVKILTSKYPGCKNEIKDGVTYVRVGFARGALVSQIAFQLTVLAYVLFLNYDVWIESFTAPFGTSFMPWFTRKPVIGLTHFPGAPEMVKKYKIRFDIVEKLGMRQYRYCIALTEQIRDRLHELAPAMEIVIIPNGVSSEYFNQPIVKERQSYFLFLGRIDLVQKGLDYLLAAYSKARTKTVPPLKIAGDGVATDVLKLKALIKQYGLDADVELVGKIEGLRKVELIRNALAVLMPSRSENHSMVALEALALGTPLICFDITGFSWLDSSNCYKVKAFDVSQFSLALTHILGHADEAYEKALIAREFAMRYSWDNAAAQYQKFIEQVLNNK